MSAHEADQYSHMVFVKVLLFVHAVLHNSRGKLMYAVILECIELAVDTRIRMECIVWECAGL